MNPVKCEENKSLSATEYDQSTRPEVSQDTNMEQTCAGIPVDHSPPDNRECSNTSKLQYEVNGCEASLKTQNPNWRISEKHFTFAFNKSSNKRDLSTFTASGKPNENIYSVLRANEDFYKRMKHFNRDIFAYEEKTIVGYVNLGMPLKCLPTDSHLTILVGQIKKNKEETDQILRKCEIPNPECILFQVVAIGDTIKKIVKIKKLHEKGTTLCIYALKGETVQEALCKDGRFRVDLDQYEWKLKEGWKNIYGKKSKVVSVSGKTLTMNIYKKPPVKKFTHMKIEQKNESATGEISPQNHIQIQEPETDGEIEDVEHSREKVSPPQSLRHDSSEITSHYQKTYKRENRKQKPHLSMQFAIDQDIQRDRTKLRQKNCKMFGKVKTQQYPNCSKDATWMSTLFLVLLFFLMFLYFFYFALMYTY